MQIPIEIEKPHIEIYDVNKNILGVLTDRTPFSAYNISISHSINDTSKLKFLMSMSSEKAIYLLNENLIKFEGEYYSIKKVAYDDSTNKYSIETEHESCDLKDTLLGVIEKISEKVGDLVNLVLSGTGWVFGSTDIPNTKLRHLMTNELSIYANLVEIADNFNARLEFTNTVVNGVEIKNVSVYANPINNGKFIVKRKGYKDINISYDSTSLVTRLYVFGKNDDATGNEISMMAAHPMNLPYVEDFSYFKGLGYTDSQIQANKSKFVKELTIRNSDLYTPQSVYNFGLDEIKRLCYPKIEATVNILDVSVIPEYMETAPIVGEVILAHNEDNNLTIEAQIVSVDKSYENPLDISIGISNVINKGSTFKEMSETTNIVEKITDGPEKKIHGMYIKDATIGSAQIGKAVIDDAHIRSLNADKINAGTISAGRISGSVIEAVNLSASEAVINSAKIGGLDAKKITAGDIETDRLVANVISAINLSATGTIKAKKIEAVDIIAENIKSGNIETDRLKANVINAINSSIGNAKIDSAKIGDLSADIITSGYIKSELIEANSITSDKLVVGDTNNLCKIDPNSNIATIYTKILNSSDGYKYFKIGASANNFIMLNKSKVVDFNINDEYILTFIGAKDYGALVASIVIRYYYSDGTYSEAGKVDINLTTISNGNSFNGSLANQTIKITTNPLSGKTLDYVSFTIQKDNSTIGSIYAKDIRVFKKNNGSLIVDGTIDANKIKAFSITANQLSTNLIVAGSAIIQDLAITNAKIADGAITNAKIDDLAVTNAKIDDASITNAKIKDAEITGAKIAQATIEGANIVNGTIGKLQVGRAAIGSAQIEDLAVTSAKIANGAIGNAQIGEAVIETTHIADGSITDAKILNLSASKLTAGKIDAAEIEVLNLKADNITVGTINGKQIADNAISKDKLDSLLSNEIDSSSNSITKILEDNGLMKKDIEVVNESAIRRVTSYFAINQDPVVAPILEWDTKTPEWKDGWFIWEKIETEYLSGTKVIGAPVNITGAKGQDSIEVEIVSSNGNIFKNGDIRTNLKAIVKRGIEDITDTIDANRFRWIRISKDTEADKIWNSSHFGGTKEISITKDDVNVRATFNCEILE